MRLWMRTIVAWCLLLVVMFANGTARVLLLERRLGEDLARQVASVLGICVLFAAAAWFVRANQRATGGQLAVVGCIWLLLTLAFEFGFGRYVSHRSWSELLADYDLMRGRLWPLVLVATLVAPWLCGRLWPHSAE